LPHKLGYECWSFCWLLVMANINYLHSDLQMFVHIRHAIFSSKYVFVYLVVHNFLFNMDYVFGHVA
jgi:hypothetical protein